MLNNIVTQHPTRQMKRSRPPSLDGVRHSSSEGSSLGSDSAAPAARPAYVSPLAALFAPVPRSPPPPAMPADDDGTPGSGGSDDPSSRSTRAGDVRMCFDEARHLLDLFANNPRFGLPGHIHIQPNLTEMNRSGLAFRQRAGDYIMYVKGPTAPQARPTVFVLGGAHDPCPAVAEALQRGVHPSVCVHAMWLHLWRAGRRPVRLELRCRPGHAPAWHLHGGAAPGTAAAAADAPDDYFLSICVTGATALATGDGSTTCRCLKRKDRERAANAYLARQAERRPEGAAAPPNVVVGVLAALGVKT